MKRRWMKFCKTDNDKAELRESLKYSTVVFKTLTKLLEEDIEEVKKTRRSLRSLVTQNYSEYQADRNATERTLEGVLELIKMEK